MRARWEMKTLGEIGKVSMCKRVLKKQTTEVGEIPFYKIGTFGKTANAFISKELYDDFRSKYSFPKEGDVLISASGTIGRRVVFDGNPAYFQDSNIVWIDNDESQVLNEYLYTFYGYCDWNPSKGATISRLYNDDLRRIQIPIPPLPEQKAIVKILDEAFAKIDQAKANIEKNIENAKELFQSKLNEIFSQRGEGWEEKILGDVSSIKSKLVDPNEFHYQDLLHVGGGNIVSRTGELVNLKTAKEEGLTSGKFNFDESVVLYNKIRPYLIKVTKPDFKGLCSADMYPITPNTELITRDFLYYLLVSKDFTDYAISGSGRAALPKVNRKHLFGYKFQLPSLQFQARFTPNLNRLKEETESSVKIYYEKLQTLNKLKKSLLQKAFSGELV